MNIATAGHVDHGKTSLVKALTQIDTDRLAEEKRRGMSIDLGFAYADFGGDTPAGFVDVPGHERFVRNMLAGVASIDLALIVIAADDGPMPQTHEHLAILELLGVKQGVVALTKIDRVSKERLAEARQEVDALLASSPFQCAPIFPLVATDGESVQPLRDRLIAESRALPERPAGGHFRLAIDRSFTLAGAGRIVTGAVLSGVVQVGDEVVVSPQGSLARVRGIRAQNQPAEAARARQRCALNLAGNDVRHAAPSRGDWIVAPALHAPTQRIDAQVSVLASEPKPLADRAALQLHVGAAVVGAHLAPLEGRAIGPGEAGLAQLLLDAPIAALHGDRFILRDAAGRRTVAGGRVIDPFGPARGRARPPRLAQLAAMSLPAPESALAALLESDSAGVDLDRFALARNLKREELEHVLRGLPIHSIEHDGAQRGLSIARWRSLREAVRTALATWHAEQPDSLGPTEPALAEGLHRRDAPGVLRAALTELIEEGAVQRDGMRLRLAAHRAVLSDADAVLFQRAAEELRKAGLRAPIVGDLARRLAMDHPLLLSFLERTSRVGRLVRVAPNRFYLPETVVELFAVAKQLAGESATKSFDTAAFKDRSGIGRNLSVQVLEFMDREGLTRFDGKRRKPIV